MAINLQPTETGIFRVVQAIRQLIQGRSDATLLVTLAAGATTTVVTAINCSKDSEVFLSPRTANAAAALPTTYIKSVDILNGSFSITHANNGQTDRTYGVLCIGG
jgi:hypothetical protein